MRTHLSIHSHILCTSVLGQKLKSLAGLSYHPLGPSHCQILKSVLVRILNQCFEAQMTRHPVYSMFTGVRVPQKHVRTAPLYSCSGPTMYIRDG